MSILHVRPQRAKAYGRGDGSSYGHALNGYESLPDSLPAGQVIALYGDFGKPDTRIRAFPIINSGGKDNQIIYRGFNAKFPRYYIDLTDLSWIRIEGCIFTDHGQVVMDGASYCTLAHCSWSKLRRDAIDTISLGVGSHYNWISHCSIEYCGNAIYARSRPDDTNPAKNLLVENCRFQYIASGLWAKGSDGDLIRDGHAVGIQAGSGHIIRNNVAKDCGTAFCMWAGNDQPMNNILIEGNTASKCRALTVEDGTAFKVSGDLDPLPRRQDRLNIRVVNNKAYNCAGYGTSANVPIVSKGNTYEGCKLGDERIRNPFE